MILILDRSYKAILATSSGFHKQLKKVIFDIDERLKGVESLNIDSLSGLSDLFALKTHTHDEYVTEAELEEDYVRNALNSQMLDYHRIDEFSLKGHKHDNIVYVANFTVPTIQTGSCTILTEIDMSHGDFYILNHNDNFSLTSKNENGLVLHYDFEEELTNTSFVCFYWNFAPRENDELVGSNINVDDVYSVIDEPVDIVGYVTDDNNNPITEGNVNFEISDDDDNN